MAGLLSSMYIWVDKISDIRITLNDIYMITLMTGWMLLFMNIGNNLMVSVISIIVILISLLGIRRQVGVNKKIFFKGMIPHHSMAIHVSKELLKKGEEMTDEERRLIKSIIETQEREIKLMRRLEK